MREEPCLTCMSGQLEPASLELLVEDLWHKQSQSYLLSMSILFQYRRPQSDSLVVPCQTSVSESLTVVLASITYQSGCVGATSVPMTWVLINHSSPDVTTAARSCAHLCRWKLFRHFDRPYPFNQYCQQVVPDQYNAFTPKEMRLHEPVPQPRSRIL